MWMYAISCCYLFTFFIRSLCRTIYWWTPESPRGTSSPAAAYPSFRPNSGPEMAGPLFREEGEIQGARDRQNKQEEAWLPGLADGDSPERRGILVFILSLTADSPRKMSQQIEEKKWLLGSFHPSMLLLSVPTMWFFSVSKIFALPSVANLFQWSLLQTCSANSYVNAANGAASYGTEKGRGGRQNIFRWIMNKQ